MMSNETKQIIDFLNVLGKNKKWILNGGNITNTPISAIGKIQINLERFNIAGELRKKMTDDRIVDYLIEIIEYALEKNDIRFKSDYELNFYFGSDVNDEPDILRTLKARRSYV